MAVDKAKRDLDITSILITLRKLKAGLAAVIQNDEEKLKLTKSMFYEDLTISVDEPNYHNEFKLFLEEDVLDEQESLIALSN
jgi:hypothetical protein